MTFKTQHLITVNTKK